MKVRVYRNLKNGLWSIVAMEGTRKGYLIGHASHVSISGCTFQVRESRRQAICKGHYREVHAWVIGHLVEVLVSPAAREFTYNPHRAPTFTDRETGAPVTTAQTCWFTADQKAFAL